MKVLALDLATKTGWAHSCGASGVYDLSIRRDESSGMRLIRLNSKLNHIRDEIGIDLLIFEAARHNGPGMQGALVVHAELQGTVKLWCELNKVAFRGYSPSEIKKHATGKGNANKEKMVVAAEAKWPNVEIIDDNQADAMWLLDLALQEYVR
jgi:Holliday junction resolvasome RuvABC endonuclease subunit